MSISKFTFCLTALAVLLTAMPSLAQREIRHIPPLVDADGYNPDFAHPFVEPNMFNPDYQFFAPAEFTEFGKGTPAPKGWFASYDRVYIWMTRPENQFEGGIQTGSPTSTLGEPRDGDFGWGNRYEIGYMTSEDHGWLASFFHLGGPNIFNGPEIERLTVFNALDQINNNPQTTISLRGGMGGMPGGGVNPGFTGQPARDANDPITGARDYRIENSVNVASISSFELNKTWRIRPLHYGSIVEPFLGFRYMKFSDLHNRDTYDRLIPNSTTRLGTNPPLNPGLFTDEEFVRARSTFDNNMIGGQLGVRWFKRKNKWNLSGELRAFGFQNFQSLETVTSREYTTHAGMAPLLTVGQVLIDQSTNSSRAAEFVMGTEIRAQAAYNVTRDVSIRLGGSFMELGRGIGRGNNILQNSQSVTMVGAEFGFTVNR